MLSIWYYLPNFTSIGVTVQITHTCLAALSWWPECVSGDATILQHKMTYGIFPFMEMPMSSSRKCNVAFANEEHCWFLRACRWIGWIRLFVRKNKIKNQIHLETTCNPETKSFLSSNWDNGWLRGNRQTKEVSERRVAKKSSYLFPAGSTSSSVTIIYSISGFDSLKEKVLVKHYFLLFVYGGVQRSHLFWSWGASLQWKDRS